jgi:tRNA threonylcarbamoyladenosine biosynthesis protein TsaE
MVISLEGKLGVGKTTFVKGIAKALGIEEQVTSPSFTIMSVYRAPISLYHIDLYRIDDTTEIMDAGLGDVLFDNQDGVAVVEWGEKADEILPAETIRVRITFTEGDSTSVEKGSRSIAISGVEL